MDSSIVIRNATLDDAAAIKDIMDEAFVKYMEYTGIPNKPDALFENVLDIEFDIKNFCVLIALVNGTPAGSVRVEINDDKTAYLKRFGVKHEFNNIGVGKAIMAFVDEIMVSNIVNKLSLHTAFNCDKLIRFYGKCGFNVDSVSNYKGYLRALMVKEYDY